MLRTNLSTRPFYNVRVVQTLIGACALIVLAMTVYNAVQLVRLTSSQRTLGAHAADAEREAARLRQEAAQLRLRIDPKELAVVATAAREANGIIDRRVFSWTDLFTQFEATLPEDVRITQVQPRTDDEDRFIIGVAVEARTDEDLDAFIEALERTGTFRDVLPVQRRQTTEGNLIEAIVEGVYVQRRPTAAAAPAEGGPRDEPGADRAAPEATP